MVYIPDEQIWIVVAAFIISFILAFALGANDVANAFSTSVGSKVLTLRQACVLGSIFETLGAVLLGARVSDTIRKGIIDVEMYKDTPDLLLVGYLSALTGAGVWLLVATILKLPVSGTHSIVGATVGFALVAKGSSGINFLTLGLIAASWIIGPALSGIFSVILYLIIRSMVLRRADRLVAGLKLLPSLYGVTVVVNAFSVFFEGPEQLYLHRIPLWGSLTIAFALGTLTSLGVRMLYVPWQRKRILTALQALKDKPDDSLPSELTTSNKYDITYANSEQSSGIDTSFQTSSISTSKRNSHEFTSKSLEYSTDPGYINDTSADSIVIEDPPAQSSAAASADGSTRLDADRPDLLTKDTPEVSKLFSKLQILTACFGSFAHGANDVSNAIGPLVAVWIITIEGSVMQKAETPIWVLVFGGVGISIGLWVLGRRVIETMGSELTAITPSSAFTIEIGAAFIGLAASSAGLPISTTHCKVGAIVFVGRVRSKDNVDWKIFGGILLAWIVTLPAAGLTSAAVFYGLQHLVAPLGPPWALPLTTLIPNVTNSMNFTSTVSAPVF